MRPYGFCTWDRRKIPMENLLDLFLYICRDLKADYDRRRNKYKLSLGSLTVDLDVAIDKMDFHEVLQIKKIWDSSAEENIVYSMDYIEPHIFEAHEKERIKSDPKEDWIYQAHLQAKNKNRYLSKEMFVDNITISKAPDCRLEYATDNLGRGLRSLAHLRMLREKTAGGNNKGVLFPVYTGMLIMAEDYLTRQLGEDRTKWKAAIRRGKAEVRVPFKHRLREVYAPWILGYELVRLCRFYSKMEVH